MISLGRRKFLGAALSGLAGGAALATKTFGVQSARAATARVEVLLDEPIAIISPDIYGHFTEHLGGVIYDGIWVGENSKVPNTNGIRTALIEHMRRVKPSVIRYPGGCFADSYNWRDGIGPRNDRPQRTNFWADDPGARAMRPPGRVLPMVHGSDRHPPVDAAAGPRHPRRRRAAPHRRDPAALRGAGRRRHHRAGQ